MVVRIESDLKTALKAGEKRRVATLRLLLAALRNEKIQSQRDLTEEEIETAIRRAVKNRIEPSRLISDDKCQTPPECLKCGMVHEEVRVPGGWGRRPRGLRVVFRYAKARPFCKNRLHPKR